MTPVNSGNEERQTKTGTKRDDTLHPVISEVLALFKQVHKMNAPRRGSPCVRPHVSSPTVIYSFLLYFTLTYGQAIN
jgi:hypothetical protein